MIAVKAWKCEWCGKILPSDYSHEHGDYCSHAPRMRTCASCSRSTELIGSSKAKCADIGYCKYTNKLVAFPGEFCSEHQLIDGYEKYTE